MPQQIPPPLEDVCMAHRYLYYVKAQPVISDYEYDRLEKEALMLADKTSPLWSPGSDCEESYSEDCKALAETLK